MVIDARSTSFGDLIRLLLCPVEPSFRLGDIRKVFSVVVACTITPSIIHISILGEFSLNLRFLFF